MISFSKTRKLSKSTANLKNLISVLLWTSMEELNISGTHRKHKQQIEGFTAMHNVNSIFTASFKCIIS